MDSEQLLAELEHELNQEIEVYKIYIFGSMARGDYHSDSDVDIAVISEDFEGLNHRERYEKIISHIRKSTKDTPVDLVCYTPEEFEKDGNASLPHIIEEEGIST